MSKLVLPRHKSDIEGLEYAECLARGPACCATISVNNLSLSYCGVSAFRDVSLTLPPCAVSAIIGPSGCGKTSFLQCFNRLTDLIPGTNVTGSVSIGATEVYSDDCDVVSLRKRVGMIFQRPVPFPFSITKNFHLALKEHGVRSRAERDFRMESALKDVGLWDEVKDRLSTNASALSGGQQQRLCIARAIALNPEVLLLDEPCSALDPVSSSVIEELITALRGRFTIVLVTHNLGQARRLADYVALFWLKEGSGQLIEHGPAEKLFDSPEQEITRSYMTGATG